MALVHNTKLYSRIKKKNDPLKTLRKKSVGGGSYAIQVLNDGLMKLNTNYIDPVIPWHYLFENDEIVEVEWIHPVEYPRILLASHRSRDF